MDNSDVKRLCNRHMAKALDFLDNKSVDDKIKRWIKKEFEFLKEDLLDASECKLTEKAGEKTDAGQNRSNPSTTRRYIR